jgi:hypothetical protein
MVKGQTVALGLAADGVSPSPRGGVALINGGPLPEYYSQTIALLDQQIRPAGWQVVPWGYDWRLSMMTSGAALAAAIQAAATPASPCVVVAASGGGLVARVAWSILVASGQTDLVQRVITLGTPHQGSYSIVQIFSGGSTLILGVALLAYLPTVATDYAGVPPAFGAYTVADVVGLILSWPSYYQVLPTLGSPDSGGDPNRPRLYSAANWADTPISPTWLAAAETFSALLNSAASMPPANAMTTIAGTGLPTPDILAEPSQLGFLGRSWGSTEAGDGSVPTHSALVQQSWGYILSAAHNDLPFQACQTGLLAAEVLAVRPPATPVPPMDEVGGPMVYTLAGPPISTVGLVGVSQGGAAGGDC